jgi:hypothetical protein
LQILVSYGLHRAIFIQTCFVTLIHLHTMSVMSTRTVCTVLMPTFHQQGSMLWSQFIGDLCPFSAKWRFSWKPILLPKNQLLESKSSIFISKLFGENGIKILTSVPDPSVLFFYFPDNCSWATSSHQQPGKLRTWNHRNLRSRTSIYVFAQSGHPGRQRAVSKRIFKPTVKFVPKP